MLSRTAGAPHLQNLSVILPRSFSPCWAHQSSCPHNTTTSTLSSSFLQVPWDIPSCDLPHAESRHGTARREAGLGAGFFLLSENLSPTFPARILGESAACTGAQGKPGLWERTVAHGVSHSTLLGSWYQKCSASCPPSTPTAANAASFF